MFTLILFPYVKNVDPLTSSKPFTDGVGVVCRPQESEMEMLPAAGFKWIRFDLIWNETELNKGKYNFTKQDILYSKVKNYNISAIFPLAYQNSLYEKSVAVLTEAGREAYAQWASAAVDHFKGNGILWEIWNEPNGNGFWNNNQNVTQYIAMALKAAKTIKAKNPKELILGPVTYEVDLKFLEDCFKAGLLNYWDAVSVHPYRHRKPETVFADYYDLKNLIAKYAPNGKKIPIIVTEWGYSDVWQGFNSSEIQGKLLPRVMLTNAMNYIPVSIWYDFHDDGTSKTDAEHHFGIVEYEYHSGANPVYTPKVAYLSAKTMNYYLKGFTFVKRIATNEDFDYVMLFINGQNLRLAVWTSYPQSRQISIPSDNCNFEIINYKGDQSQNVSATNGRLTLTLTDSPKYIIVKQVNNALKNAPEYQFRVIVSPIHGKTLSIRIFNLRGNSVNGTLKITNFNGINPHINITCFQFQDKFETTVNFCLKYIPDNKFSIDLRIETNNNVQTFATQKFQFLPQLNNSRVWSEGDPNIQSNQSISVHSAPQPLFDSDFPVLKIDYQFYGHGWKFIDVNPANFENQKISGQPKAFGIWVYGDNQRMTIVMKFVGSAFQFYFQIRPESHLTIDWV
ncbi:MAG TPA: hypothetical protein VIY47_08960, partial [Ignavibacteriaceae bacterium]